MPKKITVRFSLMFGGMLYIEHDDEPISHESVAASDEPGSVIKGIEITLGTLGYKLDKDTMYMDMDLLVAHFYRKTV